MPVLSNPPSRLSRLSECGLALILLAAMALAGAAECRAQTPASPTRNEAPEGRAALLQRHVDAATRAYGQGQYERALVALRKAETVAQEDGDTRSLASIRYNIARCLEMLGRKEQALEAYRAYDALPDLPHRKEKAFSAMRNLEAAVLGVLAVTCQQDRATVVVPQVSEASQSCPYRSRGLAPGEYEIEVSAPGFARSKRSVYVRPGATTAVDFDLSPLPKGVLPSRSPVAVEARSEPAVSSMNPWPWVTMGTGAVAVGVGGIFNALAVSAGDDASAEPPTARREELVSDFESNRDLAYVFYGAGGAVLSAGIVWQILEMTGDRPELLGLRATTNGFEVSF